MATLGVFPLLNLEFWMLAMQQYAAALGVTYMKQIVHNYIRSLAVTAVHPHYSRYRCYLDNVLLCCIGTRANG